VDVKTWQPPGHLRQSIVHDGSLELGYNPGTSRAACPSDVLRYVIELCRRCLSTSDFRLADPNAVFARLGHC